MKNIEMIATFTPDKFPTPIRFRIEAEDQSLTIVSVDRILFKEEDKREQIIKYRCECVINDIKKVVDLFYMKSIVSYWKN